MSGKLKCLTLFEAVPYILCCIQDDPTRSQRSSDLDAGEGWQFDEDRVLSTARAGTGYWNWERYVNFMSVSAIYGHRGFTGPSTAALAKVQHTSAWEVKNNVEGTKVFKCLTRSVWQRDDISWGFAVVILVQSSGDWMTCTYIDGLASLCGGLKHPYLRISKDR